MPEFAEPRKPYGPIKNEYAPKQSLGAFDQTQQAMEQPLKLPSVSEQYKYQPTQEDVELFAGVGVSPVELFGAEAVMATQPDALQFDPDTPGYKNNDTSVYDDQGNEVYEGEVNAFNFDEASKQIYPNPDMNAIEHNKNFYQDDSGTWFAAKTNQPVLPYRQKTGWENIWQAGLDPLARVGHWMENVNTTFWERLIDQKHKIKMGQHYDMGKEIWNFKNTVGNFTDALWEASKDILNPEGLSHGWKTDVAPTQPGIVKLLMGLGGADEAFYQDINELAAKEDSRIERVIGRAGRDVGSIWRGSLTEEGLFGTELVNRLVDIGVIDIRSGKTRTDVGRSMENFLTVSTLITMSTADPFGAADLALTGGFSMLRRARHLNKFGLLGKSRKALDEYRAVLKSRGPDFLIKMMQKNNPDLINSKHWADLYAEASKKQLSSGWKPFTNLQKRMSQRLSKYGMGKHSVDPEALKNFIALDPELAIKKLGTDGYYRLVEMLPPTSTINGKPIYNYHELLNFAVKAEKEKVVGSLLNNVDDIQNLLKGMELKSLRSGSLISAGEEANYTRKTVEGLNQTAAKVDDHLDSMTEAHLFDEMDRGRVAGEANRERAKRGFVNEKFSLKNHIANELIDEQALGQLIAKAANKLLRKRSSDVVDTPQAFAAQLSDPAIRSAGGEVSFRKTAWNTYRAKLRRFANKDKTALGRLKRFALGDEYQYVTGGRMGGLTDDAVKLVKEDISKLRHMTRSLDAYQVNKSKVDDLLSLYPELKMPAQFTEKITVAKMSLKFGPKARQSEGLRSDFDVWGGMPGLQTITKLDGEVQMVDAAGKIIPEAADRMNLYAAQAKIWDGGLLEQGVVDTARSLEGLKNGIVPGGRYGNMGEAIDGLLEQVGLQKGYKAMEVQPGEWTVVDAVPFNASDTAIDTANRAATGDIYQINALENAINNPNKSKADIAEELSNDAAKRNIKDIDAEASSLVLKRRLAGKDVPKIKDILDELDLPLTGKQSAFMFHGSSSEIKKLDDYSYGSMNIYGQGLYTTSSRNIAKGYTKKGKGVDPTIHTLTVKPGLKLFDLETPLKELNPKILNYLDNVFEGVMHSEDVFKEFKNPKVRDFYDEVRAESSGAFMTADDVQELFSIIGEKLDEMGYSGLTHLGGKFTGKKPHTVNIYFNPSKDLEISAIEKTNFEKGTALNPKARALWQQERQPGRVSLGDIGPERLDEILDEDLINNWEAVKTPEMDELLVDQIRTRLSPEYRVERSSDHIAVTHQSTPGQAYARAEAGREQQGRALMRAINEVGKDGAKIELFSNPLPKLDVLSDQVQVMAQVLKTVAKDLATGTMNKKTYNMAYRKIRAVLSETKARAWMDARELYGDMAYRERLRMNEVFLRQKIRDESLETVMLDLIDDADISANWKNVYKSKITPKFAKNLMLHKTPAGKKINTMLEEMGRAAEGIKYMPENGDELGIIFGTKNYKTFAERVPTDTHIDGKARPGMKKTGRYIRDENDAGSWNSVLVNESKYELNPANAKALWGKLTPKQKHYLTEYTREGGTKDALFANFAEFNREVAADMFNVTSKREGYMHHTFHWNEGEMKGVDELPSEHAFGPLQEARQRDLREAKADPRKFRKGDLRYQQNFIESISEYTKKLDRESIRNHAFAGLENKVMKTAAEVKEMKVKEPGLFERMVIYKPQFPENVVEGETFYVDKIIADQLAASSGMSWELSKLNDFVNIGKKNLLAHTGTWSVNLMSAVAQQSIYNFENMFRAMMGDKKAFQRVSNMPKALMAAIKGRMPNEIFGAHSTRAFQYGKKKGVLNEAADFMLTPMGAIENFFKRWTAEQELLTMNKTLDNVVTAEGRIMDMDAYNDISKATDLYNLDYSNTSTWTNWLRKNPVGGMIMPFATFPYKMSKSMAYYGESLLPQRWYKLFKPGYVEEVGQAAATEARRNMMARFLTANSLMLGGLGYGMASSKGTDRMPDYMEGMDYQTNNTGRINFGFMDEDSYVRYAKYPGLNVFSATAKLGRRLDSGETLFETTNATWHEVYDSMGEMFTIGGDINLVMSGLGHNDKYNRNKSFMQQAIGQMYHHIPGLGMTKRWGEDINKMVQQSQGGQSRSIRNAQQQLVSQIPFTAYTHPELQGDVTRFSSPQDNQVLRSLFGINIRKIDLKKAQAERKKAEAGELKKEKRAKLQERSNIEGKYIAPKKTSGRRKRRRRR